MHKTGQNTTFQPETIVKQKTQAEKLQKQQQPQKSTAISKQPSARLVCAKGFYSGESKKYSMRVIDAKILDELEMLYGDKDCFYPLHEWFGTAEAYWTNLERLFMVADYAKKHNPSIAEKITAYSRRIVDLFHQTKDYASGWDSNRKEKHRLSTEDYVEATDESWDALDKWTVTQEKLRRAILEFVKLLYSVVSES